MPIFIPIEHAWLALYMKHDFWMLLGVVTDGLNIIQLSAI